MKTTLFTIALIGSMLTNAQTALNNTTWNLNAVSNDSSMDSVMSSEQSLDVAKELMTRVYMPPPQRPFYNNFFRIGAGYSINTLRIDNSMRHYNDTSEHNFEIGGHSPIFTFSHYLAIDTTFSLGYSFGYTQSDIKYDKAYYGEKMAFVGLHPMLYILRTYNFEYYVKLNLVFNYTSNNLDMVKSDVLQRTYPTGAHFYTGFTFAGINYLVSDNFGINAEFNIWSHETVNFGLTYRFNHLKNYKSKTPDWQKLY